MSSKNTELKLPWILAGYELFAKNGPGAVKIEVLEKIVKKSKSSFYHHFADLEIFTDHLLTYHLERAGVIAKLEGACKNIDPELINVLTEVKIDLLFNRQLRIYRNNEDFRICFEKSSRLVAGSFLNLWANEIGLNNNQKLAEIVFNLALENFYLQITEETLNTGWLSRYFRGIQTMIEAIKKNDSLYGNV